MMILFCNSILTTFDFTLYNISFNSSVVPSSIVVMTSSLAFWLHALDQCGARVLVLLISVMALLGIYLKNTHYLV